MREADEYDPLAKYGRTNALARGHEDWNDPREGVHSSVGGTAEGHACSCQLMNSHQRVVTAMKLGQPDRVPIVETVFDPGVRRAIYAEASDGGQLAEFLDLDAVGCGPVFRRVAGDAERWVDEWGVHYQRNPEANAHPVQGAIGDLHDLRTYRPPDPDAPYRLGDLPEYVRRYKGERAIIFHHRAAFMWSCHLLGIENMLIALVDDPDLASTVLDVVVEVNEQICRNAVRAGADIVTLGDDYAMNQGPLFSPATFRRHILPRLQRVVDAIHEEGALAMKHSDGNLWPILDMIVDTGVEALNPIEPTAGMDIAEVKARYGDRICLVGNIDCGELLSHGSVEEVERAVGECIAVAAPGGGFMLSSSNSIHSSVDPDNYVAMVHAGRRHGSYPVNPV